MRTTFLALVMIASPIGAQSTTNCYRLGTNVVCNSYPNTPPPAPDNSNVDALRQQLLESNGQYGKIMQQAQNDALQRRLMQQRLQLQQQEIELRQQQLDAARRASQSATPTLPTRDTAYLAVNKLIAEGDCPTAIRVAIAYGYPDIITDAKGHCPG